MYYFDIPTSFLVLSGTGDYGVSVEIDITTSPTITNAFSDILKVSQEDWDSLSGSIWNTLTSSFGTDDTFGGALAGGVTVDQDGVDSIVTGVWDATDSTFNTADTMGRLQNTAGTGGVDIDLLVSGVWNANAFNFSTSGTIGGVVNFSVINSSSIETLRKIESNRWLISGSQQIFFEDDGVTPALIVNLFKDDGSPFVHDSDAVVERVPTGSLA